MKKGILLISGGIDSPVAGYLMMSRGVRVSALHFAGPGGQQDLKKVKRLLKTLSKSCSREIRLYTANHKHFMEKIALSCNRRYTCVLCKRMMLRIAQRIAQKEKDDFIITGSNLGQVASQTLDNIAAISGAVDIPIVRPVLCNDKQETVDLAKRIGTYQVSVQPAGRCPYLPRQPITRAKQKIIEREESKIPVQKLVEDTVNSLTQQTIK